MVLLTMMVMTKLSTWFLCLFPVLFGTTSTSVVVRAQAATSYWERTDCGPEALTAQDFVSCLLSEPDGLRDL